MHEVEFLNAELASKSAIERMTVPGGWVYLFRGEDPEHAVAMTFVPRPATECMQATTSRYPKKKKRPMRPSGSEPGV